jgi:hypothetical protein
MRLWNSEKKDVEPNSNEHRIICRFPHCIDDQVVYYHNLFKSNLNLNGTDGHYDVLEIKSERKEDLSNFVCSRSVDKTELKNHYMTSN